MPLVDSATDRGWIVATTTIAEWLARTLPSDYRIVTDADVSGGVAVFNPQQHEVRIHPNATTWTMGMNAGFLLVRPEDIPSAPPEPVGVTTPANDDEYPVDQAEG